MTAIVEDYEAIAKARNALKDRVTVILIEINIDYAGRMHEAVGNLYFIERIPGETAVEFEARRSDEMLCPP